MSYDAKKAAYQEVTILGRPALFAECRIDNSTVPKGLYRYELRHGDENWGDPVSLSRNIIVNYYGAVLTREPFQLPIEGWIPLEDDSLSFQDGGCRTLAEFQRKYPVSKKDVIDFFVANDDSLHDFYFSHSEAQDKATGCVGHLRGDFGSGKQFFTTWWPHQGDQLNTPAFKADIDRAVNWLREQPDSPLHDFDTMKRFCGRFERSCAIKGATLSSPAARAVGSLKVTLSTNRILVDGKEVRLTAYNINGNNYVMLRDVGKTVGFEVYWDGDTKCVQIESDKPYTGEAPVKAGTSEPASQPEVTTPADEVAVAKQDIVDRTNALRRAKGVAALRVNDKLTQAAQVRADEIAASGVYSHTRPDGRKSNTVTDSKYTGENLHNISELYLEQQHKTLSEAVVELWSNSKAHADNMTSARYGEIGVGLARGIDKDGFDCWYCVQVFLLDGCEVTRVDTPANK